MQKAQPPAILVTGAAGFIGFHVAQILLQAGVPVIGLDNLNTYYDPALKLARLDLLKNDPRFSFVKLDLADRAGIAQLFETHCFEKVVHLAAQAGVRYSIDNPRAYVDSNLEGFMNVLEGCRHNGCKHLLFASSSSVYGGRRRSRSGLWSGRERQFDLSAPQTCWSSREAHVPNFAKQQHAFGLCGIEQTFEQHEHLARLHIGSGADGKLIEAMGSKARVDLGCSRCINPPAQGVLQRVVLGLILEPGSDPNHVDAAKRSFDCLLTIGLQNLVTQHALTLGVPGEFGDVDCEQPLDSRSRRELGEDRLPQRMVVV